MMMSNLWTTMDVKLNNRIKKRILMIHINPMRAIKDLKISITSNSKHQRVTKTIQMCTKGCLNQKKKKILLLDPLNIQMTKKLSLTPPLVVMKAKTGTHQ